MAGYYAARLAGERLRQCYELARPRVRQCLEAETAHVLSFVRPTDCVLELGCGYGRALAVLATRARAVIGIDTAAASLQLATQVLADARNCHLCRMDAARLGFRGGVAEPGVFDVVVCIQNGISAFGARSDAPRTPEAAPLPTAASAGRPAATSPRSAKAGPRRALIAEALRVTRPGGLALFSSYSPRFWEHRLEWFRLQAAHGLVGEIDGEATGDGVIVCRDGFRADTISPGEFAALTAGLPADRRIAEVDASSVFCELRRN